jgi:hypothetical protein
MRALVRQGTKIRLPLGEAQAKERESGTDFARPSLPKHCAMVMQLV